MIVIYNYNNNNWNNSANNANIKRQPEKDYFSAPQTDFGSNPFIVDIAKATANNDTFRTVLWTGGHLQLTLMSIPVGADIGIEMHPGVDQFLRIESGQGLVRMGNGRENLYLQQPVYDDCAIFVPAGTWHNIINTGNKPLKLYSIYAPPNHPKGTVHQTKADAEAAESKHY